MERLKFEFNTVPGLDDTWVSSERIADLTVNDTAGKGTPLDVTRLRELFEILRDPGLWSIQVTIPTTPESEGWRKALSSFAFRTALNVSPGDLMLLSVRSPVGAFGHEETPGVPGGFFSLRRIGDLNP
ncbi:hypothetical protein LWF01_13415 [Saxibacter everestensis]|uniref:Uncharacterized protein n=1 Tax=Saxibacter everestensis TaxID=2909229 RepID=A0ABY8QQ30_9MICO|nr:hypothetical protein LWF01_13415 [Brevibacteriaceae bacterium ZFBP1038]